MGVFSTVQPTAAEIAMALPGDAIIAQPGVTMDRAFTLPAPVEKVWPWFLQLGKHRAGWYFPRWIEWLFVPGTRGIRVIDPQLQHLHVGDRIDDWGGKKGYLDVAILEAPHTLVYESSRGKLHMSWAITLHATEAGTRVLIRLRLAPVSRISPLKYVGGFFDFLTILGLAAGLRERLAIEHQSR